LGASGFRIAALLRFTLLLQFLLFLEFLELAAQAVQLFVLLLDRSGEFLYVRAFFQPPILRFFSRPEDDVSPRPLLPLAGQALVSDVQPVEQSSDDGDHRKDDDDGALEHPHAHGGWGAG